MWYSYVRMWLNKSQNGTHSCMALLQKPTLKQRSIQLGPTLFEHSDLCHTRALRKLGVLRALTYRMACQSRSSWMMDVTSWMRLKLCQNIRTCGRNQRGRSCQPCQATPQQAREAGWKTVEAGSQFPLGSWSCFQAVLAI